MNVVDVISARQGDHEYPIRVGAGAAEPLGALADEHDKVILVSCRNVLATAFGKAVRSRLSREAPLALVHVLADGEKGKTLRELERASVAMLRAGATRGSLIVALGGGAVTDAAGFLAATFMRGVRWVAVPTTLLGMVDAAIGGKTGVNLPVAKNAVGAFHPPEAVLADPEALRTLSPRELASGKGEVMKYAALQPTLLDSVAERSRGPEVDPSVIAACARMKADVVEADPMEKKGPRKLLNLGHTFGHGVEAAGRFSRYTHGEAVAVGMAFAFRLAHRLGRVGEWAPSLVERLLSTVGLPTRIPSPVARSAVKLMAFDKKRGQDGLLWVLPREVDGSTWAVEWDVAADPRSIEAAVSDVSGSERARPSTPRARRATLRSAGRPARKAKS